MKFEKRMDLRKGPSALVRFEPKDEKVKVSSLRLPFFEVEREVVVGRKKAEKLWCEFLTMGYMPDNQFTGY